MSGRQRSAPKHETFRLLPPEETTVVGGDVTFSPGATMTVPKNASVTLRLRGPVMIIGLAPPPPK